MPQFSFDQCVKCTLCLGSCPVLGTAPGFPGPKGAGPELARFPDRKPDPILEYCTLCKRCELACPSGVKIAGLNLRLRSKLKRSRPMRDWFLGNAELASRLASPVAPVANAVLSWGPVRVAAEWAMGLDRRRPFPKFAARSFKRGHGHPAGQSRQGIRRTMGSGEGPARPKVAYFAGCYATYNDPDLAEAVVEVLERNGFDVVVPDHRCCGLPLIANGFLGKARDNASHNIEVLMKYAEEGIPVVTASPGCGLTIQEEYPELFGLPGSQRVAGNLYDISEFLMYLHEKGQLNLDFAAKSETLAYHAPCHLLALGIGRPSLALLRLIPGMRVIELPEGCCGIAGTYGFKKEKYEISMAVGKPLFEAAQVSGAARVATDCETCGLQFEHGSGLPSIHPIKVLRDAYNRR